MQACQQTNIEFVIGIAQGRKPLDFYSLLNQQEIAYVGRLPPAYLVDVDGNSHPYADLTYSWLCSWYEDNCATVTREPRLKPM